MYLFYFSLYYMELSTITDNKISGLAYSRFVQNPRMYDEDFIKWLEQFGLSVSEVLQWWFATPIDFNIWPSFWGWYKDYTSWRSFQASFKEGDGSNTTFINKWNDVFEWDKYRRYHKEDGTYVWQELIMWLIWEHSTSTKIQEQALKQLGRLTYTTIPLSVSRVDKTLSEKGEIIQHNDYLNGVLSDFPEYKEGLIRMFVKMWIITSENITDILTPKWNALLVDLVEQYPMWTYMYLIKGLNTRLVEHKRIWKHKLEFILKEEYPNCISDEGILDKKKILEEFCRRLWENLWITYSAGLSYKRESECVLIDTTIWWISMDNWHVWEWINKEEVLCRLGELYSTIAFFKMKILGEEIEGMESIFKFVLIAEMLKHSWDNTELIKDFIGDTTIVPKNLSKHFYMVNDFGNVRKTLKRLSIVGVGKRTMQLPIVRRNYFISW